MNKKWRMIFLSIFVGILALTACGSRRDETPEVGVFYEPEFISVTSEMTFLDAWCVSGGEGYMLCREQSRLDFPYVVQRIPADGGGAETLPEYQAARPSPDTPASDFTYSGIPCALQAGPDGTLWESVGLCISYAEGGRGDVVPVLRHLDREGRELSRTDFDAALAEDPQLGNLRKFIVDGEGTVYADYERGIAMLDEGGNIVFSLAPDGYDRLASNFNSTAILGDGRIGMLFSQPGVAEDDSFYILRTIDKEKGELVDSFRLKGRWPSLFNGDENALFYYTTGDTLCAWHEGSEEGTQILNLTEAGVDSSYLRAMAVRSDGEIVFFTQESASYGPNGIQMVRLALAGSEKKVLTLATTHMWGELQQKVLEFNRSSQEYHISVTDYSQYGSYNEARTRLATEIIAGNVPDLLAAYEMPAAQWAARGVLEDLWPYIDRDPELGRDKLMTRVLEAAEIDGKLYAIGSDFQISTLVGAAGVVGDRMTWTMEDMMDAWKTMPEDCALFSYQDKTQLLASLIDWSRFVDRDAGTCNFDSEEFRALVTFCGDMPDPVQNGSTVNRNLLERRLMLMRTVTTGFLFPSQAKTLLGGDISYVGYPNAYGGVGSSFFGMDSYAMCSACREKDGAWAFLRMMLLPQGEDRATIGFPIHRDDFEYMAKDAMKEPEYWMYEDGSYHLDENGEKIPEVIYTVQIDDSLSLEIDPPLLTQADYDKIVSLYNAIDSYTHEDSNLSSIIKEVSGAYFAGDQTLDKTVELIQNRVSLYLNEQS